MLDFLIHSYSEKRFLGAQYTLLPADKNFTYVLQESVACIKGVLGPSHESRSRSLFMVLELTHLSNTIIQEIVRNAKSWAPSTFSLRYSGAHPRNLRFTKPPSCF